MNLKRLETFLRVADQKSFSDVAEALGITQPGVSKQIKTLEDELGVTLLNRDQTSVELTPAGKLVYDIGQEILEKWYGLLNSCQQFGGELTGVLHIGASSIPGSYLVPKVMKEFHELYPKIEQVLTIYDSTEVLRRLETHQVDVAFVGVDSEKDNLAKWPLVKDQLVVIGKKGTTAISEVEDLLEYPFILREKGSGTRISMDHALKQYGLSVERLQCIAEVRNTSSILPMVEQGLGLGVVSQLSIGSSIACGHIDVMLRLPTDRHFYLVCEKTKLPNQLIDAFVRTTLSVYSNATEKGNHCM